MNLTDEQKAKVREWAGQGDSLGAIQRKLEENCGVKLTYMEMRMLVADLEVSLRGQQPEQTKPDVPDGPAAGEGGEPDALGKKEGTGVTVTLDNIAQPSAVVSGKVQFGDGEQAYWAIDVMGRLALEPEKPGYRPKEQDIVAFQSELRQAMRRAGF